VSGRQSNLRRHDCIVTASADQTARIWDAATAKDIAVLVIVTFVGRPCYHTESTPPLRRPRCRAVPVNELGVASTDKSLAPISKTIRRTRAYFAVRRCCSVFTVARLLRRPPSTPLGSLALFVTAARPSSRLQSGQNRRPRSSPHLIGVRAPAALTGHVLAGLAGAREKISNSSTERDVLVNCKGLGRN